MLNIHFQMQLFCWRFKDYIMTEVVAQADTVTLIKPRLLFSFYLCLKLTSPNYAFMRRRLYSKRKVKEYDQKIPHSNTIDQSTVPLGKF